MKERARKKQNDVDGQKKWTWNNAAKKTPETTGKKNAYYCSEGDIFDVKKTDKVR